MTGFPRVLERRVDGNWLEARLFDGITSADLMVVERSWGLERSQVIQELVAAVVPRPSWPESLHWDWGLKSPHLKLLASAGFGLMCEEQWQGVMLTLTAPYTARLSGDRGKPLVYIDYLEVAPWNWVIPEIGCTGRFRGVGSHLFWSAVALSRDEGFHGRVGLHALPRAEPFYAHACGMTPLGPDPRKENLRYFELSREAAHSLLSKGEQL